MPGEIISEQRATSNRNGGRDHPGTRATSVGISTQAYACEFWEAVPGDPERLGQLGSALLCDEPLHQAIIRADDDVPPAADHESLDQALIVPIIDGLAGSACAGARTREAAQWPRTGVPFPVVIL